MYLGWNFCGEVFRSKENEAASCVGFSRLKSDAICLRIESVMMTATGEKLSEALGEDGAGALQFITQQSCAALTDSASIFFFLQQSIADIPLAALPENTEVPASMPEASAKSRKSDVSHFFIYRFTLFDTKKRCQGSIFISNLILFLHFAYYMEIDRF